MLGGMTVSLLDVPIDNYSTIVVHFCFFRSLSCIELHGIGLSWTACKLPIQIRTSCVIHTIIHGKSFVGLLLMLLGISIEKPPRRRNLQVMASERVNLRSSSRAKCGWLGYRLMH